jgi:hypothetical protein
MFFEYFETRHNPDTKREAILKLEKEILDLQWEIYEKKRQDNLFRYRKNRFSVVRRTLFVDQHPN